MKNIFLFAVVLSAWLAQPALSATPMVSAGNQFALALKADGSLSAWGRNDYGQLGNAQAAMRVAPARIEGIDRITAVVAGNESTLALRDDGTLWAWGSNGNGRLGDGTAQDKSHPVRVTGLVGVVKSVATGGAHGLAVTTDGNVWAWGWGLYGQLGNGSTGDSLSAIKVSALPAVSKVATGLRHSLALATDGTVWAWGDNSFGQLGDGTTNSRSAPERISALSNIVAISTSTGSNLALDTSGRVWAWGDGSWGALGNGDYYNRTTPSVVPGLPQIAAIVAGNRLSVATAGDGSAWMWGDNEVGQFGDIDYVRQPSPARVSALTGLRGFSVGEFHVVAFDLSGVLQTWGGNSYGQLGVGDAIDRSAPVAVSAPVQFMQVSAGVSHTAAVAVDGTVWTWGANGRGQLADGTASVSNIPTDVQGLGDAVAVSAGQFHVLALRGDGSVWAWGNNSNGALGNGSRRDSAVPQRVPGLPAISAIAGGSDFSLALEQNGTVWSWGDGYLGQLGNGLTGVAQLTPKALATISGVTQISAHWVHVLALRQDGSVWAWGANESGELGDGTTTDRSIPTRVTGLPDGVVAVATGGFHSLALDSGGNVWAWGYGGAGQLGDGSGADRYTPVRVVGLSDVVAISAGEDTSYAITRDGRLWSWGRNLEGDLGIGSSVAYGYFARSIDGAAGFQGIAGGAGSAVALRTDGTVWAWGRNFEGQLGDATFAQRNTPVLTVNGLFNGPLDVNSLVAKAIPADKIPPFFAITYRAGDVTQLSLSATTKFNATDVGKSGAVFVTAMVPPGSLVTAQSQPSASSAIRPLAYAASTPSAFALIQLTSSGWQPVVNGQLIPYTSGVLGDQLAAQTILNNTDTTTLKGAQFCIGYGASADQMIAVGTMRVVATIPDPSATGTVAPSCVVGGPTVNYSLRPTQGWNLLGNSLNQSLSVASLYGDPNMVNTVWKWDATQGTWQFYAPSMDAASLQTYATGKGYGVLSEIKPGEGYWVNAKSQPTIGTQSGESFILTSARLVNGWNLVATGNDITPSAFNTNLKSSLPGTGVTTLWAWDNPSSSWYFYAPSLEDQGGTALSGYNANKGYLDFTSNNKTLGNGTGFWVNR